MSPVPSAGVQMAPLLQTAITQSHDVLQKSLEQIIQMSASMRDSSLALLQVPPVSAVSPPALPLCITEKTFKFVWIFPLLIFVGCSITGVAAMGNLERMQTAFAQVKAKQQAGNRPAEPTSPATETSAEEATALGAVELADRSSTDGEGSRLDDVEDEETACNAAEAVPFVQTPPGMVRIEDVERILYSAKDGDDGGTAAVLGTILTFITCLITYFILPSHWTHDIVP